MPDQYEFDFVILNHSYEGYGMVMDLMSRTPPFSGMQVGELSAAVRLQLNQDHHVAIVSGKRLLGYAGWLPTTRLIAERWVANEGQLLPALDGKADAVALTVITGANRSIAVALTSVVRSRNPGVRIYFKRTDRSGRDRKTSVLNRR